MTIDYTLTPDQLSTAVYNTILIFDEYRLSRKADREGHQHILDSSWDGQFNYFISETAGGSRLTLTAVPSKPVPDTELISREEKFLKNLFRVIDKEITISPEKANTNIYKDRSVKINSWTLLWIILIVALILKVIQVILKK
jgi:hypothetical protein